MLRRSTKTILATTGVLAVLGTGIAVAANGTPTCPYGNTPQAGQVMKAQQGAANGTHQQLRKRDGTGPRHAQRQGAAQGNRGANCPYRS